MNTHHKKVITPHYGTLVVRLSHGLVVTWCAKSGCTVPLLCLGAVRVGAHMSTEKKSSMFLAEA
uniref:Uncharacterized protein n=1 Tax=Cannabis sativa TaxID=3483 RepID=A0A803RAU0_CANSA